MPQWDPPFKYRNSTITRKMHMHYRCTYFTNSSIAQKPHHIFMCFGCKKAYFVHFIDILFPFRLNDKCYVMIMILKYKYIAQWNCFIKKQIILKIFDWWKLYYTKPLSPLIELDHRW